ncbi:MAG: c-type cytochrome [Anaerolineales bacterium]|nr:c-type cytochrome [Anaerolineales bacterium]
MNWRHALFLALLSMTLLGCSRAVQAGDPDRGSVLYNQQTLGDSAPGCVTCHSLAPGEVKVGPSHAGIVVQAEEVIQRPDYHGEARLPEDFLRESITNPDLYIEQGFQAGIMYPNYAQKLSGEDIEDLVAFLMTLR